METEETIAIALWAIGVVLILAGILVTIGRIAVYRHTGTFRMPYRRGVAPLLIGLAVVSVAAYLLGVRRGLVSVWGIVGAIAVIAVLLKRYRR